MSVPSIREDQNRLPVQVWNRKFGYPYRKWPICDWLQSNSLPKYYVFERKCLKCQFSSKNEHFFYQKQLFLSEIFRLIKYYVVLFLCVTFFVVSVLHLGAIGLWDRTSLFIEFSDSWKFQNFQNFFSQLSSIRRRTLIDLKFFKIELSVGTPKGVNIA